MDRLREWARRVWYLANRRRLDADLQREMAAHRAEMADARSFGNDLRLREESRDVWGWSALDRIVRDVRLAVRTLRRSPVYTLTAVAILSLGIGVTLAFFQIVNATIVRPPAVKDPETLVRFNRVSKSMFSSGVPYRSAEFVRTHNSVLAATLLQDVSEVAWGDDGELHVLAAYVSANWFDELGAAAAQGRVFHAGVDDRADALPAVVVSDEFWRARLGQAPDVVGRAVRVNGRRAAIAGVTDRRFPGVSLENPQVWVPLDQIEYFNPGSHARSEWSYTVEFFARLKPGVSPGAAKAALGPTLRELAAMQPDVVRPDEMLDPYVGAERFRSPHDKQETWTIVAATAGLALVVLLIACLNLSTLALGRAIGRVREMSVRTALGASRWRVAQLFAIESGLVAGAGVAGGLLVGIGAAQIMVAQGGVPPFVDLTPDWRLLAAVATAGIVAFLGIGFVPVWKVGRRDLTLATRDGGERVSQGLQRGWLRYALVFCQIAGSCLLLVLAGQISLGLQRLLRADLGFDFANVAVLNPSLSSYGMAADGMRAFWADTRQRLDGRGDVVETALSSSAPLGQGSSSTSFSAAPKIQYAVLDVEPQFFSLMRIPILAGRTFAATDTHDSAVIVSRQGALAMYGTLDVVGSGFPKGREKPVVVGVAGDAHLMRLQGGAGAELYSPISQNLPSAAVHAEVSSRPVNPRESPLSRAILLVRAKENPADLLRPMREAARDTDSRILARAHLMRDDFQRNLEAPRLASVVAGLTALLALVLASLGMFGVVSHAARLRTKEIGIRMALGAGRGAIIRALLMGMSWSAVTGMALGFSGAFPIGRLYAGAPLYLRAVDVPAYAIAASVFTLAGALAMFVPVLRTLRADPIRALRQE